MESENIRRNEELDPDASASVPVVVLDPPPARILVKEVNWLGDLVMSIPALRAIRRTWPHAYLAVLVKNELASFFDGAGWIDEVIPYSVGRGLSGFFDRRRIVGDIRSRRFDLGVLFPNSFESALWIAMAHWLVAHPTLGAPIRRYGHIVVPFVLIGLGFYILYDAGSFGLLRATVA